MKVAVLEYITGGGFAGEPLPESLAQEGQAMLRAVLDDLLALDGLAITVLYDIRVTGLVEDYAERVDCHGVGSEQQFRSAWQALLLEHDAVFPIAPETDAILERLCVEVEEAGKLLLNSDSSAVQIAASKMQTYQRLLRNGIPVVETLTLNDDIKCPLPWIIKPDDGVGAEGVHLLHTSADLTQVINPAIEQIIQPYIHAQSASLSVLFSSQQAHLLTYNEHGVSWAGQRLQLSGCEVGLATTHWQAFQELLNQIRHALPGLRGYVGIDLLVNVECYWVLEINPRLTTSYVKLHQALGINPAELILRSCTDEVLELNLPVHDA